MQESAQAALSYVRSNAAELVPGPRRGLVRDPRHPHPRAGRRDPEGRPERRRGDGDRARVAAVRAPGAQRRGDDRRDHADRPGAADRRAQGEGARRAARRDPLRDRARRSTSRTSTRSPSTCARTSSSGSSRRSARCSRSRCSGVRRAAQARASAAGSPDIGSAREAIARFRRMRCGIAYPEHLTSPRTRGRAMPSRSKKAKAAPFNAADVANIAKANPYIQRLIEDAKLRDNVHKAIESTQERVRAPVERQDPGQGAARGQEAAGRPARGARGAPRGQRRADRGAEEAGQEEGPSPRPQAADPRARRRAGARRSARSCAPRCSTRCSAPRRSSSTRRLRPRPRRRRPRRSAPPSGASRPTNRSEAPRGAPLVAWRGRRDSAARLRNVARRCAGSSPSPRPAS